MSAAKRSRQRRGRVRAVCAGVAALALVSAGVVAGTSAAQATTSLTVTPTTTHLVSPNSTTLLTGLSVAGDTTDNEQVTLTTDLAGTSISITSTSGVTRAYGYSSWTGLQSITFTGLQSDINTALASAELVSGSTTGTAHVSLTATLTQVGYDFLGPNQHFYEYVSCNQHPGTTPACTWDDADSAAKLLSFQGQQGYLATIPDSTVNNFVSTKIANAADVWIGARAYESTATDGTASYATDGGTTYARVWRWTEGSDESPIAGTVISDCTNITGTCSFSNGSSTFPNSNASGGGWSSGEPNDARGSSSTAYQGEYVAVTNWSGSSGLWNDIAPDYYNDLLNVHGYVVEFGGKQNSDPTYGTGFAGVVTATSAISVASAATVPSAPTITGTGANGSATVNWSPPVDGGAAIDSYQLSRDGGATWSAVSPTTTTSLVNGNLATTLSVTVTSLANGTAYPFAVRAHNSVGYGAQSNTATVTPATTPTAPTITGTRADSSATVSWAPAADGGESIDGYQVSTDGGTTWSAISPALVGGRLVVTLSPLSNGTAYPIEVRAHNGLGYSVASNTVVVTPATVPGAPLTPTAVAGNSSATVSFATPNDGGSPITSYLITSSPGSLTVVCGASPCSIDGLTNSQSYTFTVAAINSVGTGPSSTASSAVVPLSPVSAQSTSPSSTGTRSTGATSTGTTSTGTTSTGSCGPSSSAVPVDSPVVPGRAVVTVDCEDTTPFLTSSSTGLHVTSTDGLSLDLVSGSAGGTLAVDSNSVLTVKRSTSLSATVTGLEAGTTASFWVFSTPILLGQSIVTADLSSTQAFHVPSSLVDGDHTLVVTGQTSDGHQARLAIGFVLTSDPTTVTPTHQSVPAQRTSHRSTAGSGSPLEWIGGGALIVLVVVLLFWLLLAWRRRRRRDETDPA